MAGALREPDHRSATISTLLDCGNIEPPWSFGGLSRIDDDLLLEMPQRKSFGVNVSGSAMDERVSRTGPWSWTGAIDRFGKVQTEDSREVTHRFGRRISTQHEPNAPRDFPVPAKERIL